MSLDELILEFTESPQKSSDIEFSKEIAMRLLSALDNEDMKEHIEEFLEVVTPDTYYLAATYGRTLKFAKPRV